ncbi:MAG: transposase [Chloroflexota bacterium]|nr:transposase [Chloroflexota bacterium]
MTTGSSTSRHKLRTIWREQVAAVEPERLIFVDETGTNISMTRRYGRAPRGQRVIGQVPRNHGPNVTLIAAMARCCLRRLISRSTRLRWR